MVPGLVRMFRKKAALQSENGFLSVLTSLRLERQVVYFGGRTRRGRFVGSECVHRRQPVGYRSLRLRLLGRFAGDSPRARFGKPAAVIFARFDVGRNGDRFARLQRARLPAPCRPRTRRTVCG